MSDTKQDALVPVAPPELPDAVTRRGISEAQWRTLANNLFPGAASSSVLMVWDYCAARGLDPMKKPCHIVPMEVKDAKSGEYNWRDVVMPGIYEYRITAHRTGQYLGHSEAEYGPLVEQFGVNAPEWVKMTVYRFNPISHEKVLFPVTVYFSEVVATRKNKKTEKVEANARWMRAPRQMLAKCAEAAALREAFPEEIGGEPTADEMDGQRAIQSQAIDTTVIKSSLDRIPDGMRDNIDRAFAALNLSPAARLTRANEFLGGDVVDPEAGAQELLDWCQKELTTPKQPRKKKDEGNGKPKVSNEVTTTTLESGAGSFEATLAETQAQGMPKQEEPPPTTPPPSEDLF